MKSSILYFGSRLLGASFLVLGGCSSGASAPEPAESLKSVSSPLYSLDDPTTVSAGTPVVRTASCPGRELPDQCGSWAGVELSATRSYWPPRDTEGEHCLCQAIDFQIPASIPVTRGNAGIQLAELEFRKTNGKVTHCFYQGDQRLSHGKLVGGTEYDLQLCTDGAKAGSSAKADWFSLDLKGGNPLNGPTEVQLRLGEPDVVGGVVQEQVFFSDDARLAGAALHVPRGSAPALQGFSLDLLRQVPIGTNIDNGGAALKTATYAVDVHATGVDNFAFTPVPGASCPRIDLPYDPTTLASVAGPGAESRLHARQILDLAGVATGGSVLAPTGPVTVDTVNHTVSFCVQHLSYYVAGVNATDGNLTGAYIAEGTPAACTGTGQGTCSTGKVCVANGCYTNVLNGPPPSLKPSTAHTLLLEFTNETVLAWQKSNMKLVSVKPRDASNVPAALNDSPWFPEAEPGAGYSLSYAGAGNVGQSGVAAFKVPVTTPRQETPYGSYEFGSLLNLCLQTGASTWISECFSWDPGVHPTTTTGTGIAQLSEICDNFDNDGVGGVDDGPNGCGGICPLAVPKGTACSNGEKGICEIFDVYGCRGWNATQCNAPSGASRAVAEICGNGLDDDCNGTPDDGNCCTPGEVHCVGTHQETCGSDGLWGSNRIVVGQCGANCDVAPKCGECRQGTIACNDGISSDVCTGDAGKVPFYSDADGDTWCTTTSVDACPNDPPPNTRSRADCIDSTWGFRSDCIDSNGFVQNGCCEKLKYGPSYYKQCCGGPEIKTFDYDCDPGWHVQSCSLTRIEGFGKTSKHFEIVNDSCVVGSQTGTLQIEYALDFLEGVEGFGVVHCLPDGLSEQPRSCPIQ